jgi:hypothetical protein
VLPTGIASDNQSAELIHYSGMISPEPPIVAEKSFSETLIVESVKAPLELSSFTENASLWLRVSKQTQTLGRVDNW